MDPEDLSQPCLPSPRSEGLLTVTGEGRADRLEVSGRWITVPSPSLGKGTGMCGGDSGGTRACPSRGVDRTHGRSAGTVHASAYLCTCVQPPARPKCVQHPPTSSGRATNLKRMEWNGLETPSTSLSLYVNCIPRTFIPPRFLSKHSTDPIFSPAHFVSENCWPNKND